MGRHPKLTKRAKALPHRELKPPPPSKGLIHALNSLTFSSNDHNVQNQIKKLPIPRPSRTGTPIATQDKANNGPSSFRMKALKTLEFALNNSYTVSTSKNHAYAVARFLRFAANCGYSEAEALPCPPELLCMWIADGVGRTGVGTATANIGALSAWHKARGLPFEVPIQMRTIKRSIKLHWPEEKQQKPIRPPITPRMIRLLTVAWAEGSSRQKCALAIALTAFMGQTRLGELLPVSVNEVARERLPSRARWALCSRSENSSLLFLPWTKTTGKAGALITLPVQAAPLDPTMAICLHLISSPLVDDCLLCEFVENGELLMLDKEMFMAMCNGIWGANGFQRITGHSFRIGGTTSLLLSGVDPEIVKGMGRWSSDTFKCYWRKVEVLFAQHTSNVGWVDFDI